jgi:hypothetical protein
MGAEASCRVDYDGHSATGKARLETDHLFFKGDFRLRVPLSDLDSVEAGDGALVLDFGGHRARFHLGNKAVKWADQILHPKSVTDKLGVKPGQRISLVGFPDAGFLDELRDRGADVSSRIRKGSDVVFYWVEKPGRLDRLAGLKEHIHPDGAIWVIRPKGLPEFKETHVFEAATRHGLVDVKVVSFSDTHSALKLVIPIKDRRPA